VKSTIHWVSAEHAIDAEVRLYENLFATENPGDVPEGQDFTVNLHPNSLEILTNAKLEPSLAGAMPGDRYQFERLGYFCADLDSKPGALVFNRTVPLRDTWAKIEKREKGRAGRAIHRHSSRLESLRNPRSIVIPTEDFSPSGGICGLPALVPPQTNRRSLDSLRSLG